MHHLGSQRVIERRCRGLSSLSPPLPRPNLRSPRPPPLSPPQGPPRLSPPPPRNPPLFPRLPPSSLGPGLASLPRSLGSPVLGNPPAPSGLHPLLSLLKFLLAAPLLPLNPRPLLPRSPLPRPPPLLNGTTGSLVASLNWLGGFKAFSASLAANNSFAAFILCLLYPVGPVGC